MENGTLSVTLQTAPGAYVYQKSTELAFDGSAPVISPKAQEHDDEIIGRTAIFEYLPIDDDIRREIIASSGADKIKKVAMKKGHRTLREDGWHKVKDGITTISEVLRVTLEI